MTNKNPDPDTVPVDSNQGENADDDVMSDPGKGSGDRSDWADEGGATTEGPATDTDES
jgi:hypothetical protein